MTKYINKFSLNEKKHFKGALTPNRTVCKVFVCVKSTKSTQIRTFQNASVSCNKEHAEFLALLNITNKLIRYLHGVNKIEITEFDLVMRLNNSPCHLSGCQFFIKYWIQHVILSLVPHVAFRLILYFSKFYTEEQEDVLIIDKLKDWALELVGLGITVFFCPIIVSQTIKCYENEIEVIIKSDQKLIINYFSLLTVFRKLHIIKISYSDGFESINNKISLKKFASDPQYICISPPMPNHNLPYPIIKVKKV